MTRGVVVVDDVLGPEAFAAVGLELAAGRYHSVHANGLDTAWPLRDGAPWRGGAVSYDPTNTARSVGARYPTSTVVDDFIDIVRRLTCEHPDVVGEEGVDWASIFLCPWLYPVGSALSLHEDGGNYSGAVTFFAHPRWNVHWGGQLLIFDESAVGQQAGWLEQDRSDADVATCVFPRPNRLVLVGPGRPHMISRVDANAGDNVRTSLAGFFMR